MNISSNTMSTTTFVSEASSLKSYQFIPLDFHSIRTLPETHVWPPASYNDQVFPIPIIDFSGPSESNQKLIVEACEKWGVFQLTNHGIPSELLMEVDAQMRRLFALPMSRKLEALQAPDGFTGYGMPRISQFFEKRMWTEGFTIKGSPADHAAQLWPDGQCQVFCDVMEDYQQRMKDLAAKLCRLILQSLNTSEQEVRRISTESTIVSVQMNSYPPCPEPTRAMGMAAHTDTSLLTLLYQGNVEGLQIFKETVAGGKWGMVPTVDGAVTVNVGDLLEVISNGRFRSVLHRVVLNEAMLQRVSVALFYTPPPEYVLSPSGVVSGDFEALPMYRSLTVKEFRELKYESYQTAQSALDAIKK
ncbi:Gibberellin 3-beta-dioxygenase 3 [Linum grandiflorum]